MISEVNLSKMLERRKRNIIPLDNDGVRVNYEMGFNTSYLLNDHDLLGAFNRQVKGYANDVVDLNSDVVNALSYMRSDGSVVALSGLGTNIIEGIREKRNGMYASIYYDPDLQASRCYVGGENLAVVSSVDEVHCTLELVGGVAYLLQGYGGSEITIGGVSYVIDSNPFYCFDSCPSITGEGYMLSILGHTYRCKFEPTYDVLVVNSYSTGCVTSDHRVLDVSYPVDTILEITTTGSVVRVRTDVYTYWSRNPIPHAISAHTLTKYMQRGNIISTPDPYVTAGEVQIEEDVCNIVVPHKEKFLTDACFFRDICRYCVESEKKFSVLQLKKILADHRVYVRNGLVKGDADLDVIKSKLVYYDTPPKSFSHLIDKLLSSMGSDDLVGYLLKRKLHMSDNSLYSGTISYLHKRFPNSTLPALHSPKVHHYKGGMYIIDRSVRLYISDEGIVNMGKNGGSGNWTRRIENEKWSSLDLRFESPLLSRVRSFSTDAEITVPYVCDLPVLLTPNGGFSPIMKAVVMNRVFYVNLYNLIFVYDNKVVSEYTSYLLMSGEMRSVV